MHIRKSILGLLRITTLLASALMALPSYATLITGTFSGVARGETRSWYDGSATSFAVPVTGSFSFETSLPDGCCPPVVDVLGPGSVLYQGSPIAFDFAVHVFGGDTGTGEVDDYWQDSIVLLQEDTQQSFDVGGGGPYWYWSMTFVDPDGGLFQNFDPATFDPRQVDIDTSFAEFSGNIRSYGATVDFDTLSFDGYPRSIPEPVTLGLFGVGLFMLAALGRRPQRDSRIP